jgi:hypothetical protein
MSNRLARPACRNQITQKIRIAGLQSLTTLNINFRTDLV